MLGVHVDDIPLAYSSEAALTCFIKHFQHSCKMNNLGYISQFLGVDIILDKTRCLLKVSQASYIDKSIKRYHIDSCNPWAALLEPSLKSSRLDEPKCKAQETALYN